MNDPRTESAELKLERLITGVVAGLPPRPAPAALERRVLAAIPDGDAHLGRAQGFAAWPMPARWLAMPAAIPAIPPVPARNAAQNRLTHRGPLPG